MHSFDRTYRSDSHRLDRDFLSPLLSNSVIYNRAAGFFSSSVFSTISSDFINFFEKGGRMNLICSPCFSIQDTGALRRAIFSRPEVKHKWTIESIKYAIKKRSILWSEVTSWLIASDYLKVKIALIDNKKANEIYHEKIGIFIDEKKDILAFSGSVNESLSGYQRNFERIDFYSGVGPDSEKLRAWLIKRHFDQLWENRTNGLKVCDLREAFAVGAINVITSDIEGGNHLEYKDIASGMTNTEILFPPATLQLMPHQEKAISHWASAGGKGILGMATGSGKTITALYLALRLYDNINDGLCILIVAPFLHLVDQWREVGAKFGLNPIRCAEGYNRWFEELNSSIYAFNGGQRKVLSICVTAATLTTKVFQDCLKRLRKPLLIIADEVHNYGTELAANNLPTNAQYRLGLTATYDNKMLLLNEYFGGLVFEYGLDDALKDGILSPYRYYPITVELNDDEIEEYNNLTVLLARYLGNSDDNSLNKSAMRVLLKRARLIASAKNKIPILKRYLERKKDDSHILVYCGDGTVEGLEDERTVRQIEEVVRVIGKEIGMRCASYTARTPAERRIELLKQFSSGDIQVLVAIRCLDEGVDIPATRTAYILASSTNPRQFIQRRGRLLRLYPGKTRAYIYDFFVGPPLEYTPEYAKDYKVMKNLVRRELKRAEEFAELAENGPVAMSELFKIRQHFGLLV